jgi:MFS family permease
VSPFPGATLRHPLGGRLALLVWATGVLAYGVAVFHRFSLGVTGIQAAERFGIGASALAVFSIVQLFVYAAMQIPVGVLLDRFGSKRLLLAGAALMASGQLCFALATDFRTALLARVLVGLGDAMTFMSVLRVVALWFPPHRNPVMVQLTALLGQLGAIASAVPLIHVLSDFGWTATFVGAAAFTGLAAVFVTVVLRDSPYDMSSADLPHSSLSDVRHSLRLAWAEPGTRLGLWTHFVTQFPMMTFILLWGYPFLVKGEGFTPSAAGLVLTLLTLAGLVCGPVLGHLVGRHPFYRSSLVLAIVAVTAATWTAVLAWPGRAPTWLLVTLVLAMASNGPGSAIGFDYARTFNPATRFGSATGIVNSGGFIASLITILLIGVVLDAVTPGASTDYSLGAFRWAFSVQYLVWALGVVNVLRYRRSTRRLLAEQDPEAYAALRRGQPVAPART